MSQSQYAQPQDLVRLAITQETYNEWLQQPNALDMINAALQEGSSFCDSFIASQFTLPLQPDGYDMALTAATVFIAAKALYDRFGYAYNSPINQLIEKRYQESLDWLLKISREEIHPQYQDSSGSIPTAGPFVLSNPPVGFAGGCGSGSGFGNG